MTQDMVCINIFCWWDYCLAIAWHSFPLSSKEGELLLKNRRWWCQFAPNFSLVWWVSKNQTQCRYTLMMTFGYSLHRMKISKNTLSWGLKIFCSLYLNEQYVSPKNSSTYCPLSCLCWRATRVLLMWSTTHHLTITIENTKQPIILPDPMFVSLSYSSNVGNRFKCVITT